MRAQHTWRTCFVRKSIGEKHKTYPETHYRPKSGKEAGDSGNKYICEKDCHQQSRGFAALGKGDGRSNAQSTISEHPFSIEDRKRGIALLKRFHLRTLRCWRMQRYADGIKIRRLQCAMWLQKIDKLISASHIYHPDIVYHITVAN